MKKLYVIIFLTILTYTNKVYAANLYDKYIEQWPKTDFTKTSLDYSRVIDGGPPKDGIPSIDNPVFKTVDEIDNIPLDEPVIAIYLNGEARAYPLRILIWHEIVNDRVGDTPIAVTYCPLCNSAIVFNRKHAGQELEFGVSGKLYKSDMLMYDRTTESWWQQYTGEAVVGDMLGKKLDKVVSRVESLYVFKTRHPNGKVLVPNDFIRSYGATPYPGYDSSVIPYLYDGKYNGRLNPMEYVVVVDNEAWPLYLLQSYGKIVHNDLVFLWTPAQKSVLDNFNISLSKDLGNVLVIRKGDDGKFRDYHYNVTFAFVFDAFHPEGVVHYNLKKKSTKEVPQSEEQSEQ